MIQGRIEIEHFTLSISRIFDILLSYLTTTSSFN